MPRSNRAAVHHRPRRRSYRIGRVDRTCAILALSAALLGPSVARAQTPRELSFDARVDLPITLSLFTFHASSELFLKPRVAPSPARWSDRNPDGSEALNALDASVYRLAWRDMRAARDQSNFFLTTTLLTTLGTSLLAAEVGGSDASQIAENTVIVAESTGIALALNQITKLLAGRARPCRHFALPGQIRPCGGDVHDENLSFFSGHTTVTTALWASSGTVASLRGYPLAPLVWGSGLFALATGYLRIAARKHYATDVLVGALVGTAVGALVPLAFHGRVTEASAAGGSALGPLNQPINPAFSLGGVF